MALHQYETEFRFVVIDVSELERRLSVRGSIVVDEYFVRDEWYVPQGIVTYEEHEQWLDSESATPIRLRTLTRADDRRVLLEIKTPTEPGNYSLLREVSVEVRDESAARNFLRELSLKAIITLEKTRTLYDLSRILSCSIDRYSDGSTIFEVEAVAETADIGLADYVAVISRDLASDVAKPLERSAVLHFIERYLSKSN